MSITYKVQQRDGDGNLMPGFRAVEAKSKNAVLQHIAGPFFEITAFTKADYQAALKGGVEIEDATKSDEPKAGAGEGKAEGGEVQS